MLHVPTHHPEGHEPARRGPMRGVPHVGRCGDGWDDRVVRTLSRSDRIGMVGIEVEARTTVLHGDAPVRNDHAAAEAGVAALDERNAATVRVRRAQQDRAAGFGDAGVEFAGVLRIDSIGEGPQSVRIEQLFGRPIDEARIRDVSMGVGEPQLHGFDLEVQRAGVVGRNRGEIEVSKDAKGDQGRDALAVGRYLVERGPR